METLFATSPDGTRIAFDVQGEGPAVILLHGGGHTRQRWHETGYVNRLKSSFTIITIDIRGNGESDKPTNPTAYTTNKICEDILAVADDCGADRFSILGFSFGGNIARYLTAQSERVDKVIIVGISFGPGVYGEFAEQIPKFLDRWKPITQAQLAGTFDPQSLNERERTFVSNVYMPAWVATIEAMVSWGTIEPADLLCSALLIVGTENKSAMTHLKSYHGAMEKAGVHLEIFEGLTHNEEFTEIDVVLPTIMTFLRT
ncbi:MAG: alpha/beta fold hydrolase [Promethearchaeota archaeon]